MSRPFTLGPHREVVLDLLQLLRRDVTVWNTGLVATGRRSKRYIGTTAVVGTLRLVHLNRMRRDLETDPTRLEDRRWVVTQTMRVTGEYLLGPLLYKRRSYWRGEMSDAPFFMQTWLPIALAGAHRGPAAAATTGGAYSAAIFTAGAILNGERRLDRQLATRLLNYTGTGLVVGCFVALVVRALGEAEAAAADTAELRRALAEQQHDTAQRRALRADLARADRTAAEALTQLEAQILELDTYARGYVDDALATLTGIPDEARGADLTAVVARAEAISGARLVWTPLVTRPPTVNEIEFLHGLLEVTLTNAREHALIDEVAATCRITRDGIQICVESGTSEGGSPVFKPGHGLADVRLHARSLGGDVTIEHTGNVRAVLPHPNDRLARAARWTTRP